MAIDDIIIPDLNNYRFEQGPIRPPSEAYSLLIRVTRNCPWNRCLFCSVYKGQKFELRPADDVIEDIKKAKAVYEEIKKLAWKMGKGNGVRDIAGMIYNQVQYDWSVRNVGLWLWAGGKFVFLQDANSLIMRTPDLVRVISFIRESFPEVNRITTYARSKTAAQKSLEDLIQIREAGLSRTHIGMESGSDEVLRLIDKGVTGQEHIEGGKKIKEAGISLSEYIMPGLGGRQLSQQHVEGTANVLNQINPDFIRLRTFCAGPHHLIWPKIESGELTLQTDDEVAAELGKLIERLEVTSYLASDHISNLLPELEGKFPEAKTTCLNVINKYLSFTEQERMNYKLGRRLGYYDKLDDIKDRLRYERVKEVLDSIEISGDKNLDDVVNGLKAGMA